MKRNSYTFDPTLAAAPGKASMIKIEIEPVWRFRRTGDVQSLPIILDFLAEIRATNPQLGRQPAAEAATKKWLMGAAGIGGISAAGLYELYQLRQQGR